MSDVVIPGYDVEDLRFLVRGGTAANLAVVNEIPFVRELVVERDTLRMKLGDGVTHYNDLPYVGMDKGQLFFGAGDRSNLLTVGSKALVPVMFNCKIGDWVMVITTDDNSAGTVTVDVQKVSYADFTDGRPASGDSIVVTTLGIAGNFKATGDAASFSNVDISEGDILVMEVLTRTTNVTHVALAIKTEK